MQNNNIFTHFKLFVTYYLSLLFVLLIVNYVCSTFILNIKIIYLSLLKQFFKCFMLYYMSDRRLSDYELAKLLWILIFWKLIQVLNVQKGKKCEQFVIQSQFEMEKFEWQQTNDTCLIN
ncbi:transmembrane protein, putative (macronuclear) [Tetrahymena thermophila SB210]|uniref:Transmembrane protein, putative n=1 Tax=Tetrahymena thermophila (strain SB210) TaxID=312017 RepID=A4VEJ0_TETTS|nr:transmembrane protein, putative [Tetrahymena thermophila SB210]EDK31948.1 transmembrane protein, putative [Tetrahymena thermophila SB210]|eukprot:XP_001471185.1 transmembrane protein, putative [Tetrahymena thermophila SB210]